VCSFDLTVKAVAVWAVGSGKGTEDDIGQCAENWGSWSVQDPPAIYAPGDALKHGQAVSGSIQLHSNYYRQALVCSVRLVRYGIAMCTANRMLVTAAPDDATIDLCPRNPRCTWDTTGQWTPGLTGLFGHQAAPGLTRSHQARRYERVTYAVAHLTNSRERGSRSIRYFRTWLREPLFQSFSSQLVDYTRSQLGSRSTSAVHLLACTPGKRRRAG
jgi:hypothetical protein